MGFDSTQRLVVLPDGVLADAATAMGTELALDSHTADIDSLLLRAAATIAHQQLGESLTQEWGTVFSAKLQRPAISRNSDVLDASVSGVDWEHEASYSHCSH